MNLTEAAEALRDRVDIAEVVSARVTLKKAGKDLKGLCPFHDDKSPSFTVSPTKGFYYCFSCGAGGDAIKFLTELDKRSFADVVKELAAQHQIEIDEAARSPESEKRRERRDRFYEALAAGASYFHDRLLSHQPAMDYLAGRGIDRATIDRFNLGYADGGLLRALGDRYPQADLLAVRLISERQSGGLRDWFRDRLMVPIRDVQGRTIGFGGRTLGSDEPKYLNSPESELFDKGRTLFGLDMAKGAIAKQDQAIVVEGYFDVIALHAAGVENAVAALGTALSVAQVKMLTRYSRRVALNFDADQAGNRAADRAIGEAEPLALRNELDLRVLSLPAGKDADEFLRERGADQYRALVANAPRWVDWRVDQACRSGQPFEAISRSALAEIAKLPNAVDRAHQVHELAVKLAAGDRSYAARLEQSLTKQLRPQKLKEGKAMAERERLERDLAALWLQGGDRELIDQFLGAHQIDWGLTPIRRALDDWQGDRPNDLLKDLAQHQVDQPAAVLLHRLADLDRAQGDHATYELWAEFWLDYEVTAARAMADLEAMEAIEPELNRLFVLVETC